MAAAIDLAALKDATGERTVQKRVEQD
jgi:hypothetical protein